MRSLLKQSRPFVGRIDRSLRHGTIWAAYKQSGSAQTMEGRKEAPLGECLLAEGWLMGRGRV